MWNTFYVGVLENLHQIIVTYGDDPGFANRVLAAKIWRSYVHSILVAQYGPIPITQANNPDFPNIIKYESEDEAYAIILNDLKDAASKIDVTKDKFTYDVLFNGDMLKWKKFANTLRLRIALQCMKNLGATATAHVSDVMSNETAMIASEAETAKMNYENVINNENPYYIRYKRNAFTGVVPKLNDFTMTFLRSYKDPRINVYYDSVAVITDRYNVRDTLPSTADDTLRVVTYPIPHMGMPKASTLLASWNLIAGLSPLNTGANSISNARADLYAPDRPFTILSYSETLFLKAEAAKLGLGGTQTAESYYNAGIDANFAFWKISNAQRDAYKARNGIKFGTSAKGFNNYLGIVNTDIPLDDLTKIWIQRWLNYYPDGGFDAWTLIRRTRMLNFPPHTNSFPTNTGVNLPHRALYPTTLNTLNPVGYKDALVKLGIGGAVNDDNPAVALRFEAPYRVTEWETVPAAYDTKFIQKWYGPTFEDLKKSGVTFTIVTKYVN